MTKGKQTVVMAILVALAVSLPALAGPNGAAGNGQRIQRLIAADSNGDGRLTFEETKAAFPKATQERFNSLDRNGDGVLSMADRPGAAAAAGAAGATGANRGEMIQRLRAADTNNDGRITFDEAKAVFPKLTQERFGRLDRNGDGVLSMADLPDGARGKLAQRLKQADTNGDGKLSFDEAKAAFPKMTQERFSALDRNHDGFLSQEDRNGGAN